MSGHVHRRALAMIACLFVWLGAPGPLQADDETETVNIGVRLDAAPFAWQDGETGAFRGYLNDLCVEAATRAGFHFEQFPVSAEERAKIIKGDPVLRTGGRGVTLDVLCDPTTITLARLQDLIRAGGETLTFSPIVFVANSSYVSKVGFAASAGIAADNLAAQSAFEDQTGSWRDEKGCVCSEATCAEGGGFLRAAYVTGTTARFNIQQAVKRDDLGAGISVCPVEMPSHSAMVKALCFDSAISDAKGAQRDMAAHAVQYAFGDTDIAQFYGGQSACKIKPADRPLSYEPYALLVSDHMPGFRPRFIAALYEMFSDQTVVGRFGTYFPGLTKSSALGHPVSDQQHPGDARPALHPGFNEV